MTTYLFEAKSPPKQTKTKIYQKSDMFCSFATPSTVCPVKDSWIVLPLLHPICHNVLFWLTELKKPGLTQICCLSHNCGHPSRMLRPATPQCLTGGCSADMTTCRGQGLVWWTSHGSFPVYVLDSMSGPLEESSSLNYVDFPHCGHIP